MTSFKFYGVVYIKVHCLSTTVLFSQLADTYSLFLCLVYLFTIVTRCNIAAIK